MKLLILAVFFLPACQGSLQKSARDAKYSLYEMVGVEKRDLLRREIEATKDSQEEASESFADALDRLQQAYGEAGGALEKQYRRLQSSYDDAESESREVVASRLKMNTVANDLFAEWEREIGGMQSADFRSRSQASLRETRGRFRAMDKALQRSEARMKPVLAKLKDHVLFLKHHVNAQSVAALKAEGAKIEGDIQRLLEEMNASIREADAFIGTLG